MEVAMIFINREAEMDFLEEKHTSTRPHFIVIYGKRRGGKTELVKHFFRGKPHIYYLADRLTERDQLKEISGKVGAFYHDDLIAENPFRSWEQIFRYLSKKNGRFILVIDEFPYLIEANKAVSSLFQKGWDEYLKNTKIFLILLGSSVSMMESEVLSQRSPLYGRRTGQLHITPMSFTEIQGFFPNYSFEERVILYGIAGGTPYYLSLLDPELSPLDNVRKYLLTKGEFLHEEVEFLLREELKEPRNYFTILRALALGKRKLSEIINETGLEKNIATKYLSVLRNLYIVTKEVPVTERVPEKSKKGLYRIEDHFFNFWFRYVFMNRGLIEEGECDEVMRLIRRDLHLYIGPVYEDIAQQILRTMMAKGDLPFRLPYAGRWWEKNEEIDLVAFHPETKEILFGECKWSHRPVGENIYHDLVRKAEAVDWERGGRKEYYMLFSKSGFTPRMAQLAREKGIFLVSGEGLL